RRPPADPGHRLVPGIPRPVRGSAMRNAIIYIALLLAPLGACQTSYEFQPVTLGEARDRVPKPRENGQYVRAVFADLADRAPQTYDFVIQSDTGTEIYRFPVDEADFRDRVLQDVG